jgi:hypothetical protein
MASILDIIFGKGKGKGKASAKKAGGRKKAKTRHSTKYAPPKGKGQRAYSPAQPGSASRGRAAGKHSKTTS